MRLNAGINIQSILNTHSNALKQLQKSFQKLSSGKQVNQAADNIGNFGKITNHDMKIRMLNQMERNLQDELSYVQVKEGAMGEITSVVQRMRELKVSSLNETNSQADIKAMNHEFRELQNTVTDIYKNTEFNTKKVFTNKYDGLKEEFRQTLDHMTDGSSTIENYSLNDFDTLLQEVTSERGRLGAKANGLEAAARVYSQEALNELNEKSIIEDADMARESMKLARHKIMSQASGSMLIHARLSQENVLGLLK